MDATHLRSLLGGATPRSPGRQAEAPERGDLRLVRSAHDGRHLHQGRPGHRTAPIDQKGV